MSFKSWRFESFLTLQPLLLISLYMKNPVDISYLSFLLVTFLFSDLMTFGLHRIQLSEQIKEEKMKQNAGTAPPKWDSRKTLLVDISRKSRHKVKWIRDYLSQILLVTDILMQNEDVLDYNRFQCI